LLPLGIRALCASGENQLAGGWPGERPGDRAASVIRLWPRTRSPAWPPRPAAYAS